MEDTILKAFKNLGIARSTVEDLHEIISMRRGVQSEGFITIEKQGDKFVRREIYAEDVKKDIDHLEAIIGWTEKNCQILPCPKALEMNQKDRQRYNDLIGTSFLDSILISTESGRILFSDDERLRSLSKKEFNAPGVWTQAVLMACFDKGVLHKSAYHEALITLVKSNYSHISINKDTLMEAARQSEWIPKEPFTTVVKVLSKEGSDDKSAIMVTCDFIFALWSQSLISPGRDMLLISLLNSVFRGRNSKEIRRVLESIIAHKFSLLPTMKNEVLSLIKAWVKRNIF